MPGQKFVTIWTKQCAEKIVLVVHFFLIPRAGAGEISFCVFVVLVRR